MLDSMHAMAAMLGKLEGTSSEKVEHLVGLLRADGKASAMLWGLEMLPRVGPVVKFLVNDAAKIPAHELDQLIVAAASIVHSLHSDPMTVEQIRELVDQDNAEHPGEPPIHVVEVTGNRVTVRKAAE